MAPQPTAVRRAPRLPGRGGPRRLAGSAAPRPAERQPRLDPAGRRGAVHARDTPTPGGLYYKTQLLRPTDAEGRPFPDGPYGPFAYALSGFSEVLYNFEGGEGVIGIHGTNEPDSLGGDTSYGCIRMSNDGIAKLSGTLPVGVPVEIRA